MNLRSLLYFIISFLGQGIYVAAQVSIDDHLSVPFPTSLVASPQGDKIAWVFNDRGSRNVYLAENENFTDVRPLTFFEGDDGIEISNVSFSPDGQSILFVRGNAPNRQGYTANPGLKTEETGRKIYLVRIDGTEWRELTAGHSPSYSPDGKYLTYIQFGQIGLYDFADSSAQLLFTTRGTQQQVTWHPNLPIFAFTSDRSDHSFIGLFNLSDKKLTYISPGLAYDQYPSWSESGKSLVFIRTPSIRFDYPFMPQKEGEPWSIRLYDIDKKETKELWKAESGSGSVFVQDIPVGHKIFFNGDNEIFFPWEKSGWMDIYSLNLKSRELSQVTTGEGEIENFFLHKPTNALYLNGNKSNRHSREISKFDLKTKTMQTISPNNSIHWNPVIVNNGMVCFQSTDSRPGWPIFLKGKDQILLAKEFFPKNFPKATVNIKTISIQAADGYTSYAQLILPANYSSTKKYPAVIFLHGGSRRQMVEGYHYSLYYSNAYALTRYFADQGYISVLLNYRSGIGYGLYFREAENYGITGASEVSDLLAAGKYLVLRQDVDSSKIALWGGSYGGYLTAHGLTQGAMLFKVGVDIHGVHNWNTELPTFAPWYDSVKHTAIAQKAYTSSPMAHLSKWQAPVLLIHGDDDRNVPFSESLHLLEQLEKRNVKVEQLVFPDEVHGFLRYESWLKTYEATFEFINRHVR